MASSEKSEYPGTDPIQGLGSGDSYYQPNFLADPESVYARICQEVEFLPRSALTFSIFGKTVELPRDKQFYGDVDASGAFPLYRYGGDYIPTVHPWAPTLRDIRDQINSRCQQQCNHCVVNRYQSGADYIGFHQDKIRDFEPNTGVCTISLGSVRPFHLEKVDTKATQVIYVQPGSLFYLGPQTNTQWRHAIPKRSANLYPETRISLTFRNIWTKYNPVSQTILE
jgi:alkylated DNA repair dioxygenase AlkB